MQGKEKAAIDDHGGSPPPAACGLTNSRLPSAPPNEDLDVRHVVMVPSGLGAVWGA